MLRPSYGVFNVLRRRRRRRDWHTHWSRTTTWWLLPLYLAAIFVLHVGAMMVLEGMTALEAVWLTSTTIVTVGYGDLSARTTEGRIATMLLLYVGAIFMVAIAVNNWLDVRAERLERKARGVWRWNLRDHVVIIGTPMRDATQIFARLARQVRHARGWSDCSIQILTSAYETATLPQALRDLGVVHRTGAGGSDADLAACAVAHARGIIILSESETDAGADARTFDTVDRVRQTGYRGALVAECVEDQNRERLRRAGATAVVRPMRGFPEALTRALFAPGAERLIEDLFTAEGEECMLVELAVPWRSRWTALMVAVVESGVGTPIGLRTPDGRILSNPPGPELVEAQALYVIVRDRDEARVRGVIAGLANRPA